jgi:hypothetical protein
MLQPPRSNQSGISITVTDAKEIANAMTVLLDNGCIEKTCLKRLVGDAAHIPDL